MRTHHALSLSILLTLSLGAVAQGIDLNELGVDVNVDYNQLYATSLERNLPWDDRNLQLTADDLAILPSGDADDPIRIPFWYRVWIRKEHPEMRASGRGQYPHSVKEVYRIFYAQDGLADKQTGKALTNNGDVNVTGSRYGSESAIAINPVNTDIMVAGINGPSGQEMYRSLDGGATWVRSTSNLGNSCCDPAITWSPDGSVAHMVQLGTCGTICNIEIFTSSDNGLTWGNKVTVKGGQSNDKPYIHVDLHPLSPYLGNLYVHYHDFNTIEFARSTNNGVSFTSPITFNGTSGIGGDITTDSTGKIYHLWSSFSPNAIVMNRSTDGGATFGSITSVGVKNSSFDYPIPAMDNRNVFVYAVVDADISNGPYKDRVYLLYNDTSTGPSNNPSNNHSILRFYYSTDGGDNWTATNPHTMADINSVDRFNPWMAVDTNGTVHVAYYSTQNDVNRLKPDMYHVYSTDGGVTWSTPLRVSSTSSNYINDGFQWGDYNGLSVVDGVIRPIWTDNRSGIRGYTALLEDQSGDFTITASGATNQTICEGETSAAFTLSLQPIDGFSSQVTLSLDNPPTGITANFSPNPAMPAANVTVTLTAAAGAPEGNSAITIQGTGGGQTHDTTVNLAVRTRTFPALANLWGVPGNYDPVYDFNGNNLIQIDDLVARINCLPVP